MVSLDIPYGNKASIEVHIPRANFLFNVGIQEQETKATDIAERIASALRQPIGSIRLSKMVDPSKTVAVIVDDNTRLTPTSLLLPEILKELATGGVSDSNIAIVVASGTHRSMTNAELIAKLGKSVIQRYRIVQHSSTKALVFSGTTESGAPIYVNRVVAEANVRIGVGMILPHYPAGWSGGAKILLPGVAGESTIAHMHLLGADHPTLLGKTDTPCRREMESFASQISLDFIVNVVLDSRGNVAALVAGHFIQAHRAGIKEAERLMTAHIPELVDVTISSTAPVDFDFFQADKGLFSAALGTKPGGTIILVSPCHEGISPSHSTMTLYADYSVEDLKKRIPNMEGDKLAAIEALYLKMLAKSYRIMVVSEGLPQTFFDKFPVRRVRDLNQALNQIIKESKGKVKIGVLKQSAEILPRVNYNAK